MSSDVSLPTLLVSSAKSSFRLRVHALAYSSEYSGSNGRYERDGVILLSVTGADTACKAVRAMLYTSDLECEFTVEHPDGTSQRLARARFDDKPCAYSAQVAKLAPGAVHLVAVAKLPGLMPCLSDDHLFAELNSARYTTPLLRSWTGWLKRQMIEAGQIVMSEGIGANANCGVLTTTQEQLDEIVSEGVKSGYLRMVA